MIPPSEIELAVLDGRLHTGVIPALKTLPGLDYLSLYEEESQLYYAAGHQLFEFSDVTKETLASYDAVVPAYAQTPEIKAVHEPLRAAASATDREGIAFLILSGRYIGYLPTHYAERWVRDGRMQALNPERWHYLTHYSAITRKGAQPNMVLESYLEELKRLVKERSDKP